MAKKIKPSDVSVQVDFDIGEATDFAADLLEDVNAHNIAAVLRALNVDEYDLACEFIKIDKEHRAEGHLTTELNQRRNELLDRLRKAYGS